MSAYYDEEDYGDEPDDYVKAVQDKLDKATKSSITYEDIMTQLDISDYDVNKTVKALKVIAEKKKAAIKAKSASTSPNPVTKVQGRTPIKSASSTPTPVKVQLRAPVKEPSSPMPPTLTQSAKQAASVVLHAIESTAESAIESVESLSPFASAKITRSASPQKVHLTVDNSNEDNAVSDDDITDTPVEENINAIDPGHKPELTLVVVGHVDAGKSTLVGRLLQKLGEVDDRTVRKHEKDSAAIGKGSFGYAWVLDERSAERAHGVTIDIAEKVVQTKYRKFTILDAPGHKDFVPNMIKGAAQADVALLVIPATEGEYETSMSDNAQTKEHAFLLKALGVNQIVVVINKLDKTEPIPYNQDRYRQIEADISNYLISNLQFSEKQIHFIPCSGYNAENIVSLSEDCPLRSWYSGPTLQEILDNLKIPPKVTNKPFRGNVIGIRQKRKTEYLLECQVLQGKISINRSIGLVFFTTNSCRFCNGIVNSIVYVENEGLDTPSLNIDNDSIVTAMPRDHVILRVTTKSDWEIDKEENSEMIVYKGPPRLKRISKFRANIVTAPKLTVAVIPGAKFMIYLKGVEMQCQITHLHSVGAAKPGDIPSGRKPKLVPPSTSAMVTIQFETPMVLDSFHTCRALGRFALRSKGATVAVGICENEENL